MALSVDLEGSVESSNWTSILLYKIPSGWLFF